MSDPFETVALAAQVTNNLPPVVRHNLVSSWTALTGALLDVPVAWLEGKAKAIRAAADAEVEVRRALGQMAADSLPTDPEMVERTRQAFLARLFRSQLNKEAIAKKAEQELLDISPTVDADEQIDPDWLDMYSRIAETKSNDEMQTYFARLLAGEIRKPGTFSPATVEVLSRLSPEAANAFCQFCNISSAVAGEPREMVITSPFGAPGQNSLEPLGFPYIFLCELQDAGLIQSDLTARWNPPVRWLARNAIVCAGHPLHFKSTEPSMMEGKTFSMDVVLLTRAGGELRRLMKLRPNTVYVAKLEEWLAKHLAPFGLVIVSGKGAETE